MPTTRNQQAASTTCTAARSARLWMERDTPTGTEMDASNGSNGFAGDCNALQSECGAVVVSAQNPDGAVYNRAAFMKLRFTFLLGLVSLLPACDRVPLTSPTG